MNTLMQLSKQAKYISKYISSILLATFLSWTMGLPALLPVAYATAEVTAFTDQLSNSTISTVSNHTITFLVATGGVAADGSTVNFTFPSGFSGITSLGIEDFDIATSTAAAPTTFTEQSIGYNCSATERYAIATTSSTVITVTVCSGDGGALSVLTGFRMKIGTNAATASSGSGTLAGDTQLTNPSSAAEYDIAMAGTGSMVGNTSVYTLAAVTTVTATVAPILTFSVNSVISGAQVGVGTGTTTTTASTATTIPFGTISVGTPKTIAQRLSIATNANNGYGVTVVETQAFQSTSQGAGTNIDDYSNGGILGDSTLSDLTTWTAPTGTITAPNTWGHWGVTSSDTGLASAYANSGNPYSGATKYAAVASTTATSGTPRVVAYHDGPSDGTTNHSGSTTVAYTVQITALQEAATDYTTSLIYVASPIF